jgi:hypothetical protein
MIARQPDADRSLGFLLACRTARWAGKDAYRELNKNQVKFFTVAAETIT